MFNTICIINVYLIAVITVTCLSVLLPAGWLFVAVVAVIATAMNAHAYISENIFDLDHIA